MQLFRFDSIYIFHATLQAKREEKSRSVMFFSCHEEEICVKANEREGEEKLINFSSGAEVEQKRRKKIPLVASWKKNEADIFHN